MGLFKVKARVAPPSNGTREHGEDVELLVDTGATYSTIPESILKRLGIRKLGQMKVRLADGSRRTKSYGGALITIKGRSVYVNVLFGKKDDMPLLGATTLEMASMGVDPVGRRLIPVQAIQA